MKTEKDPARDQKNQLPALRWTQGDPDRRADPARRAPAREPEQKGPFRIEMRERSAVLWIDVPDTSVNTLREGFDRDLARVLDELETRAELEAVALASAKPGSFVAGADVRMLGSVGSAEEARELSQAGQRAMDRIEAFPVPLVAAIHGACLGGGLEMALACAGRVASSAEETELGQPEVKLGLIPGAGGTVRLPRCVGLEEALQMILTGRSSDARRARKIGLVDEVVHPAALVDAALERSREIGRRRGLGARLKKAVRSAADPGRLRALLLEDNPAGRKLLFDQAAQRTRKETHGNLPAPERALEVLRTGAEEGPDEGLRAEAEAFGELAVTREARNLIRVFLAQRKLKGREPEEEPRAVEKVGVLGAGLMGSGIATVTVYGADVPVRLRDIDDEPLRRGLRQAREDLEERRRKGKLSEFERDRKLALVRPTTGLTGFSRVDAVIEAVVEDLDVKHEVLREVEETLPETAIIASNTSSLPIDDIAEGLSRPENVVGMHYFSPVPKVPLLEVVEGPRTAPDVTATAVDLGRRQGKAVIVVDDGTGFYTSRILGPFLNEAAFLLAEGVPIESVDRALEEAGFPVGPFRLLDEVGIDVAGEISTILEDAFGDRMSPAPALSKVLDDDRKGRKNGRGFYRYEKGRDGWKRRGDDADPAIAELLDLDLRDPDDLSDAARRRIARRCLLRMVDEAARCHEDGILRSTADGDAGAVLGLGFPPFLGGPFRWVDDEGAEQVVDWMRELEEEHGARFAPAERLVDFAESGLGFHDESASTSGPA